LGLAGNELVARYRINVGRRIGSAALVADGRHARTADASLNLVEAHAVAENAEHRLLHDIPRLARATIHRNPSSDGNADPHQITAHHKTGPEGPESHARP
jgi:divalent metal cation (Fe/Co/Zn/Cd) transporter